jgi:hypothetical protein
MSDVFHQDDVILETSQTRHRDYILMPYKPIDFTEGKLHNQTVFHHVVRGLDCHQLIRPICQRLENFLGADKSVWGVKYGPNGWSVEFYFYNFTENSLTEKAKGTSITKALKDLIAIPGNIPEEIPYFMCSFEIDAESLRRKQALPWRIYTRTGDVYRQECGFSFRVEDTLILENHYWFYYANKEQQLADVVYRLKNAFRAGNQKSHKILLPKELRDCHTICYAVKPHSDSLYFSRITTKQLIWFFEHRWKHPLKDILVKSQDALSHLKWDLGIDFSANRPTDLVSINKIGLYGVL